MLEPGTLLDDRYRIRKVIGRGGTSTVYLAVNERSDKKWAVKEVLLRDNIKQQGLLNEILILKKLHHPGFPEIIDVLEEENALYIVMSYIEGETLKERLQRLGAQEENLVTQWGLELCDILIFLHHQNPPIIYRDLKPSNIKINEQGKLVLIDFGTAREWTEAGIEDTVCLGTRGYAAPEQYGGSGQTDERTDIYCLGATLYHLLTNHNPALPPYTIYPIRHWKDYLSPGLEAVIRKCTRQNPEKRYQSCEELAQDFVRCQRKRLSGWFLAAVIICVILSLFFYYGNQKRQIEKEYTRNLQFAMQSFSVSESYQYYKKAILLQPWKGEAYQQLLERVISDERLDSEEMRMLLVAFYQKKGGRECLSYYEKEAGERESYRNFCYQLGVSCFFQTEGMQGKQVARQWFEQYLHTFSKGDKEERKKRKRAKIYAKIGLYYAKLNSGSGEVNGEQDEEYFQYFFEDLKELNQNEWRDIGLDATNTSLLLYQEIVTQLMDFASEFVRAGISREEIRQELEKIESRLREPRIDERKLSELQKNLKLAEECLEHIERSR